LHVLDCGKFLQKTLVKTKIPDVIKIVDVHRNTIYTDFYLIIL